MITKSGKSIAHIDPSMFDGKYDNLESFLIAFDPNSLKVFRSVIRKIHHWRFDKKF